MKKIWLYFSLQKTFITLLVLGILLPYYIICTYLPQIPYTHYLFLIALAALKFIIFDEKTLEHKLKAKVTGQLKNENKKVPSGNMIFKRTLFHITARNISMGFCALAIVFLTILFQKL